VRLDHQERLRRKELRKLLPADKDDVAAITAMAAQGYPAVQPIIPDLFKWIRNEVWPVAGPAGEFLASIGPRLAPDVLEVLGSRDDLLKAIVLRRIVSGWPAEDVRALSPQLFLIATDGQSYGADLLALRLLAQHGIGDREWITRWLDFKREHHEKRLADIGDVRRLLEGRETA
jgi:hypothetical protein